MTELDVALICIAAILAGIAIAGELASRRATAGSGDPPQDGKDPAP